MAKRQADKPDLMYRILESIFKGAWTLISLPFKDKKQAMEAERVKNEFRSYWSGINAQVQVGHLREAVMQADIILDKALQYKRVSGSTLGERLKAAGSRLNKADLDAAWSAHKVRNQIAHELNYSLSPAEAQRTLSQFRQALKALEVL